MSSRRQEAGPRPASPSRPAAGPAPAPLPCAASPSCSSEPALFSHRGSSSPRRFDPARFESGSVSMSDRSSGCRGTVPRLHQATLEVDPASRCHHRGTARGALRRGVPWSLAFGEFVDQRRSRLGAGRTAGSARPSASSRSSAPGRRAVSAVTPRWPFRIAVIRFTGTSRAFDSALADKGLTL